MYYLNFLSVNKTWGVNCLLQFIVCRIEIQLCFGNFPKKYHLSYQRCSCPFPLSLYTSKSTNIVAFLKKLPSVQINTICTLPNKFPFWAVCIYLWILEFSKTLIIMYFPLLVNNLFFYLWHYKSQSISKQFFACSKLVQKCFVKFV